MQYIALTEQDGKRTTIEFPGLEGCATFAEPDEDVVDVAREALESWLEARLIEGESPPRPSDDVRAPRGASRLAVSISSQLGVRLEIRWARELAGISQAELAKRMHVARQQVSRLESPASNLTLATIDRVAEALGVEFEFSLSKKAG